MENYKVFIPCAGIGSRLNLKYNKALVTVGQKPAICHIIDKFEHNIEIVIALGHDGDNVKQVVDLIYSDRNITYVNIDPYEGKGSGIGLTVIQCKTYLQAPFIFCTCDTIISEAIPKPTNNWIGFSSFSPYDGSLIEPNEFSRHYRSICLQDGIVTDICSKNAKGQYPYIGLCGIYDYELFLQKMEEGQECGSIEMGEAYGLKHLLHNTVYAKEFSWFDTGNPDSLLYTRKCLTSEIKANILPKDDEAIWFVDDKVIKFSIDQLFIANRVLRSCNLGGYVPHVEASTPNSYVYKIQKGKILPSELNITLFNHLLDLLTDFWQPVVLDKCSEIDSACRIFYKDKTHKRIKQYFKTFEQIDQPENINGVDVPAVQEILDKINWDWICKGLPTSRFHGDLHFENILVDDNNNFIFLDWRQDFAGVLGHGDIYYDLAKLNSGIIIAHSLIFQELYSHSILNNVVRFDFLRKNISIEIEQRFKEFILEQGYDYKKVQYLTYLVFLNCAALHHYPYGLLLFHLGKLGLWKLLEENHAV